MARDSFIVYTEWGENISILSNEQAGILVKALFSLAKDEEIPQMDAVTEMCFRFLKAQIERDSKRYEEVKNVRSEAGKKGAMARWQNGKNSKRISANGKNALYVDVDDNDDDNDDDDEKERKEIDPNREHFFKPRVKIGLVQPRKPLTEEEKKRIQAHTDEVVKMLRGG